MSEALGWLSAVLEVVNKVEAVIGELPRFAGGKLIMPESQSAKVAASMVDPASIANNSAGPMISSGSASRC